jgi:hypothetical protein
MDQASVLDGLPDPVDFARAIMRVRAFIDTCESMPKDNVLERLEDMAKDATKLGMPHLAADLSQMTTSLRERFGRGSWQT